MAVESHEEIIDKLIEQKADYTTMLSEACEYLGPSQVYSITNYAVTCEDKIVCFTGSDIMDADNLRSFLKTKFPDKDFHISEEFPGIE